MFKKLRICIDRIVPEHAAPGTNHDGTRLTRIKSKSHFFPCQDGHAHPQEMAYWQKK